MKFIYFAFWMLGFSFEVAVLVCASVFALLIMSPVIIPNMWRESMDAWLADLDEILR